MTVCIDSPGELLLIKALFFIAKVEPGISVTPTSIEFHRKYECFQNHELAIVKEALVFIAAGIPTTAKWPNPRSRTASQ